MLHAPLWLRAALVPSLFLLLPACTQKAKGSSDASGYETLEIRDQGSAGVVMQAELAEDLGYLAPLKLKYVGSTYSGPQDIQTVATGDADIGQAFNGAIVKLISAGVPVRAVVGSYGVDHNTWGGYFVNEGSPIRSARDLIGKKVAVNTVGAHQEAVLREYLSRNNLSAEEARQVTMVVVPLVNAEQLLRQGQVDAAMLQSIFRDKALERGGIRVLFSDYDLFGKFTAGSYVMRREFIERNPNTTRKLVDGIARAIAWVQTQPPEAVKQRWSAIIEKRKRAENDALVKHYKGTGVAGKGGLIAPRDFRIWIDWLVKAGQLKPNARPVSDYYTNQFNPFAAPSS
jgi:ABC-type nitrate/sulfonate/bicarbonate transport system substrate-binding protein